jgi:hypothetical protein
MKETRSKKSPDTVPLIGSNILFYSQVSVCVVPKPDLAVGANWIARQSPKHLQIKVRFMRFLRQPLGK